MLKNLGIKGILFDIDNTLEEYATVIPTQKTIDFIRELDVTKFYFQKVYRIDISKYVLN